MIFVLFGLLVLLQTVVFFYFFRVQYINIYIFWLWFQSYIKEGLCFEKFTYSASCSYVPHLHLLIKFFSGIAPYGMGRSSDSSDDYYFPKRRNFNPQPHHVTIIKSETGSASNSVFLSYF